MKTLFRVKCAPENSRRDLHDVSHYYLGLVYREKYLKHMKCRASPSLLGNSPSFYISILLMLLQLIVDQYLRMTLIKY